MVLTAYGVLTPERLGLVVSVIRGLSTRETWHLPLGRQAGTLWPSAFVSLVVRHACVHRIPLPTLVTIAKRPS